MKNSAYSMDERLREQAAIINQTAAVTGLPIEEIARLVGVKTETLRKYAMGYQPASKRLIELIEMLPQRLALPSQRPVQEAVTGREVLMEPSPSYKGNSLIEKMQFAIRKGTYSDFSVLRSVIETVYADVCRRLEGGAAPHVVSGPHALVPLGYVPAGMPGDSNEIGERVVVPEDRAAGVDFALRVQGDSLVNKEIHHGDIVLMSASRQPKTGDVVAALVDGEMTLKVYEQRPRPHLRSANARFPKTIEIDGGLQIQGVMLAKL